MSMRSGNNIIGPIRIQTTEKVSEQRSGLVTVNELIELFGFDVKMPTKELTILKPVYIQPIIKVIFK